MPGNKAPLSEPALSLDQLVAALARKGIPLPHEIGTFLMLEVCERMVGTPIKVSASEVWLSEEGEVAIAATQRARSDQDAARSLVMLLGDLLVRSAPGVPPMLLDLVEHGPRDKDLELTSLRDALEAALVPLNRAATRRVLSRLLREARRDRDRGPSVPAPDAAALDSEVDSMLGAPEGARAPAPAARAAAPAVAAPRPARPAREARPMPAAEDLPTDEAEPSDRDSEAPEKPSRASHPRHQPTAERPKWGQARDDEAEEHGGGAPRLGGIDEGGEHERKGTGLGVFLLLLSAALVAAYFVFGREQGRKWLGLEPSAPVVAPAPAPTAAAPAAPAERYGELRVSSSPARAQVLLFVGRAPTVVRGLPTGVAHELIAIDDARLPARAVVPADAQWTEQDGAPSYELALQLGAEASPGAAHELGPTRLPQALGTPSGRTGSVRVVTSPPGARVYQLVGFTPDVRVENLPLREPVELLVYLSGYELARTTLTEQSYIAEGTRWVADLDVPLTAK